MVVKSAFVTENQVSNLNNIRKENGYRLFLRITMAIMLYRNIKDYWHY
jgi:hypothetical protein